MVFVFLVNHGIKSASFINAIVTCAKVIPLILFIVVMAVSFKAGILTADFWGKVNDHTIPGTYQSTSVFKQISSSLMVMVWAFYGLEGASLLSKRAEKPSDARIASIIGMIILIVIYMLISLLPYGVLSRRELASCPQPAMSYVMQKSHWAMGSYCNQQRDRNFYFGCLACLDSFVGRNIADFGEGRSAAEGLWKAERTWCS